MLRQLICVGGRICGKAACASYVTRRALYSKIPKTIPRDLVASRFHPTKSFDSNNSKRAYAVQSADNDSLSVPVLKTEPEKKAAETSGENPKALLSAVLTERDFLPETPMASFRFSYIPDEQEANVQKLAERLLDRTLEAPAGDKVVVNGVIFCGMSGSGKSRIAVELPQLLKAVTTKSIEHKNKAKLLELLRNPAIITIDWWSNGYAYDGDVEEQWPAKLMLGIRLAAKFWFKNFQFDTIRSYVANLSNSQQKAFHFNNVVSAIIAENEAKPASERYTMLYIANDEFQKLRCINVPYTGSSKELRDSKALEPLSRSIARELIRTGRGNIQKLFVFGSFVGIGFHHNDLFPDPTEGALPAYLVRRLSINSSKKILQNELGGDMVAKVPDLERLLTTLGGNPRLLEILCTQVLNRAKPEEFDAGTIYKNLQALAKERYQVSLYSGPFTWPILLSIAGYSITDRDNPVAWQLKSASLTDIDVWSAGKVEQSGYISLRGATEGEKWLPASDESMILDAPIVIARMVLQPNSRFVQFPQGKMLRQDVFWNLIDQAIEITDHLYTNAYGFEKLAVHQLVFRWNMFNFNSQTSFVPANLLFFGGYCTPAFKQLKFACEDTVAKIPTAHPQGEWATIPKDARPMMLLASGQTVNFTDLHFRGIYFGANNVFDGQLRLFNYDTKKQTIIWLDAKHSAQKAGPGALSKPEIEELKTKLTDLEKTLPDFEHLLVVVSNRKLHAEFSLAEINDKMCIIARDGLSYGCSPWMSLVAQVGYERFVTKRK